MKFRILAVIACTMNVLLFVEGCAVSPPIHKPGLIHNLVQQPAGSGEGSTHSIDIDFYSRQFLNQRLLPSGAPLAWAGKYDSERALRRQIRRFPFLKKATIGSTGAPYRLQLESTQSVDRHVGKEFLSALTLFLLPFNSGYELELKGLFYHQGHLLKTYGSSTSFRISIQSWRIVIPWKWDVNAPDRAYEDTYADLFLQIQQDLPQLFEKAG